MLKGKFKKKQIYVLYTLEFLIIAITLLKVMGGFSLITSGDGYNQYYPTTVYVGKYIRTFFIDLLHGEFTLPQFDFSIGLGEGIIPALNYYGFGDPFMLVSAVFPVKYSTYAYTAIFLLKMYVSGLSFILFCRGRQCKDEYILMGVPLYIGSQYVLCHGMMYPAGFLNLMISTPLICKGIDDSIGVKKEKGFSAKEISGWLVLAVAFQALGGFYTLYMVLLFAAVYALINLLCKVKSFYGIVRKIVLLFFQIVLGIAVSAAIFVPSVYGYLISARSGDIDWIGWKKLLLPEKGVLGQILSSVILPSGLHEVGLMIPVIALFLLCLAIGKEKKAKEIKILFGIFLLAYVNMVFASWVAGGFTASIYYGRWTFSIIFLIAFLTVLGGRYIETVSRCQWLIFLAVVLGYIGLSAVIVNVWNAGSYEEKWYMIYVKYGIFALLLVSICFFAGKYGKNSKIKYIVTVGSILTGIVLNIYTLFDTYGAKWYLKTYESVRAEILSSNAECYYVENGFGRMDIQGNFRNEALYMGHYSANEYLSIINANIVEFYKQYVLVPEMYGSVHHLIGLGARDGIEDLLSVAYYDDVEKQNVVINTDYLPFGFTFDSYISEKDAEQLDAITKNASVLQTVILNKDVEGVESGLDIIRKNNLVVEQNFKAEYVNIENNDGTIKVTPESKIVITVENATAGECYFYADKFKVIGGTNVGHVYFDTVYCEFKSDNAQYTHGVEEALVHVKNISEGSFTFEITFRENAEYELAPIHIFTIDSEKLKEVNTERQKETLQNVVFKGNSISGTINSEKKILFLSIPYSEGWKVYVNGENTELIKADYGFSACELEPGENEIYLEYTTPGIRAGAICTILSLGIFVVFMLKKQKEKGMSNVE